VILDYLAVMYPGEDTAPLRFAGVVGKSGGPRFDKIELILSNQAVVRNCLRLEGMKIWLFQRQKAEEGGTGEWIESKVGGDIVAKKEGFLGNEESETGRILKLPEAFQKVLESCLASPPASSELAAIKDKAEREEMEKSVRDSTGRMPEKYVLQAFCEIPLNPPRITGGDDINHADPWVFPLEIGVMTLPKSGRGYYFRRPIGEKGEVPDWEFRARYFGDRGYVPAIDAILDKGAEQTDSSDIPPI
jgi:hypothetical protein